MSWWHGSAAPPKEVQRALQGLPLPAWVYFPSVDSTNQRALRWAEAGAPDGCLALADEQTQGRGRQGRRWHTPPRAALALSWVVRPLPREQAHLGLWAALAAVALAEALETLGAAPAIKWPNDVLLEGRKVAGVLVEALWQGNALHALVIGLGVNVRPDAVPPWADFPAGCVEAALGHPVPRWDLLRKVLERMLAWRPALGASTFHRAWEQRLAFYGQPVQVVQPDGRILHGSVRGLTPEGALRLETAQGEQVLYQAAQVRPA